MKPSADARVRARRRRKARTRALTYTFAGLGVLAIPLALVFIDWPVSLIVAIPLGVMVLWLLMQQRVLR